MAREGERVDNLPALQLRHERSRICEAAGGVVMEELVKFPTKFPAVEDYQVEEAREFRDGDVTWVSESLKIEFKCLYH